MNDPRSSAVLYAKGDRRAGRGPRLLMIAGLLAAVAAEAAIEWMARELANERVVLPLVLYRDDAAILRAVSLAGLAAMVAGACWLRAARRRGKPRGG